MSYGHARTHRCGERWGWNLEEMKIYCTNDRDYIGVFAEVDSKTKKVIITVICDGDVYEDSKEVAGNNKEIIASNEEVVGYEVVVLQGNPDAEVISAYMDTGIYDVSMKNDKKKEKDLRKPFHIVVKDLAACHPRLKWLVDIPSVSRRTSTSS